MKYIASVFVAVALCIAGAGCGKAKQVAADKAAEVAIEHAAKSEGKDVSVKVDSAKGAVQMTQTTDGGKTSASYGEGTKVPADFPKDVPVYDGTVLLMAQSTPADGNYVISGTIGASLDKVSAFYKDKTAAQGWKVDSTIAVPGQTETVIYKKEDRNLNITLNVEDGKTAIVLAVSKS